MIKRFSTSNLAAHRFALSLSAAALALLCATGASAATSRLGNDRITALDTNGDSMISRQEAAANSKLATNFDNIDTNHDGMLSGPELKMYTKAHKVKAIEQLDTNGDGMLTREEAASNKKLMEKWDMLDVNKDGRLSADELRAVKVKHMPNAPMPAPAPAPMPSTTPPQ